MRSTTDKGWMQCTLEDCLTFRQQRNICTSMIRKAKSNYYQSALSACDSSTKLRNTKASLKNSSWSHLPLQIKPVSSHITGGSSNVEALNHHFLSPGLFFFFLAADSTVDLIPICPAEGVPNASASSVWKLSLIWSTVQMSIKLCLG